MLLLTFAFFKGDFYLNSRSTYSIFLELKTPKQTVAVSMVKDKLSSSSQFTSHGKYYLPSENSSVTLKEFPFFITSEKITPNNIVRVIG